MLPVECGYYFRIYSHRMKKHPAKRCYFILHFTPDQCCDDAKRAEKEHLDANLKYHIEFFRNGLNAIIKLWLANGCLESPEEMAEVLKAEYRGR